MRNPFWINKHPYHHRVFCVIADAIDTVIALCTLGIIGSSFGLRATFQVSKWQIEQIKKMREQYENQRE
jgi:hypothetical protein